MLNAAVLHEKIPKNRVKNCLSVSQDIVSRDDKKALEKYKKNFLNDKDGYRIDYLFPDYKSFGNITIIPDSGRVKTVPYTGLSTFSSEVRGYLAHGIYIDVDMVNCHPVILRHLMIINDIDTSKSLDLYIYDRENFLSQNKISKTDFLISINKFDFKPKTLIHSEIHNQIYNQLLPKLIEKNELKEIYNKTTVYNKEGKFIANYLQTIEFNLLQYIYNYCISQNIHIDVLMHDGFFVRKDTNVDEIFIKNKCLDFEKVIYEKFGIEMKFKVKDHNDKLIKFFEENNLNDNYIRAKLDFEKNHALITSLSMYIEEYDDHTTFFRKSDLIVSYEHLPDKFIQTWVKDSNIRRYQNIGNYPNESDCPENIYNMWKKFRGELIDSYEHHQEGLDMILNHINVLCNNEERVYEMFLKWIAHMVQFPQYKSWCMTLISEQGAGKGTLVEFLRRLLGERKLLETTDPSRDVWGQFNDLMSDSFLVVINEMSKKDIVNFEGKAKGLVTDTDLTINKKGLKSYTIPSFHRFLITTNSLEPLNTSSKDRRNLIIRSSDELIGNVDYFKKINEFIRDDNVIKTCYEFFKNLEVDSNFNGYKIPVTAYQENLIEISESPIIGFLRELVDNNEELNTLTMSNDNIYREFTDYLANGGFKYEINSVKLGVRIMSFGLKGITNVKKGGKRFKEFELKELKKSLET